jgi:hypothetical protein
VDPLSLLVTLWVVALLIGKAPAIAGEVAAEIAAAWRGEESPTQAARAKRLLDAGVDPAAGGAFRQYAGNVWRDFWLDMDSRRRAPRPATGEDTPGAPDGGGDPGLWRRGWGRWRDRVADMAEEHVNRWRRDDGAPSSGTGTAANDPAPGSPGGGERPGTVGVRAAAATSGDVADAEWWPDPPRSGQPGAQIGAGPAVRAVQGGPAPQAPLSGGGSGPAVGPRELTATVVAVPQVGGEQVMGETAVATTGAVTGVVSGAAEARAIQRAIEIANTEYVAALYRARARLHALGDQTLSVVQMSSRSNVVALLVQAAEAAASAQAAANGCGTEVAPLMGSVARAFDARNS